MSHMYLAAGVKLDCQKLLEKFKETESVRFKEFVQIWQEMKFSCIYSGRESFAELYEFTEEVLKIAKEFFLPPHNLQTRLGGLYLLYGLYYQQPTIEDGECLVRIRLNMKEWQDSCNLMDEIREERHYDALYIFYKLVAENAFYFCAMSREYGLEKSLRKYLEVSDLSQVDVTPESELACFAESDLLKSLSRMTEQYYKKKCEINASESQNAPNQLLNYANHKIADEIKKILISNVPITSEETVKEEVKDDSIGERRRNIKDRAFGAPGPSKES